MKLIYVLLIVIATTNTLKSQFYAELGSGYAFSTNKGTTRFYLYNSFKRIHNLFTGVFYSTNIGYVFKNNIGIELTCKFNPPPTDILNNPKGIITSLKSFYDGSYLSAISKITYQYNIKNFNFSVGAGIGYNMLNYHYFTYSLWKSEYKYNGVVITSYYENSSTLYKFVEEHYKFNLNLKFSYKMTKSLSLFFNADVNSKFGVFNLQKIKIIRKDVYIEDFDRYRDPQTIITDIHDKNIKHPNTCILGIIDRDIYTASDISKLIYTQIGLRYTFGKKEVKE